MGIRTLPKKFKPLLYALLVLGISFIVIFVSFQKTKANIMELELEILSLQSQVTAYNVSVAMSEQRAVLHAVSHNPKLANLNEEGHHKVDILRTYAQASGLTRVGVADKNGDTVNSDSLEWNVAKEEWFSSALKGGSQFYGFLTDSLSIEEQIVVVSEPIYRNGEIVGVAFAIQNTAHYLQIAEQSVALASNFIVNSDFDFLDATTDDFKAVARNSLLLNQKESEVSVREIIADRKGGTATLHADTDSYLVSVEPIRNSSDWSVIAFSSESNALLRNYSIVRFFLLISTAGILLLTFLTYLIVFWVERNSELSRRFAHLATSELNIDASTGLRDKQGMSSLIESAYHELNAHEMAFIALVSISVFNELERACGRDFASIIRSLSAQRVAGFEYEDLIVGLYGPDTYLIYASGFKTRRDAVSFASLLKTKIDEPLVYKGLTINIVSKMGIRLYFIGERNSNDINYLFDCAELALEHVQASVPASSLPLGAEDETEGFYIFDSATQEDIKKRRAIARDIESATKRGELRLHYQPIFNLKTGELHSVEALVRWVHPEWGLLLPPAFLSIAEQQGHILEIGRWALEEALIQTEPLIAKGVRISMNVSSAELFDPGFTNFICSMRDDFNLQENQLMLEYPSQAIVSDNAQILDAIRRIETCGIAICMDDFNTCMQNLDYLRTLSVGAIKMGAVSTSDFMFSEDKKTGLKAVLETCKTNNIDAIVKNIHTENGLMHLRKLNVPFGQGQILVRPTSIQSVLDEILSEDGSQILNWREDFSSNA